MIAVPSDSTCCLMGAWSWRTRGTLLEYHGPAGFRSRPKLLVPWYELHCLITNEACHVTMVGCHIMLPSLPAQTVVSTPPEVCICAVMWCHWLLICRQSVNLCWRFCRLQLVAEAAVYHAEICSVDGAVAGCRSWYMTVGHSVSRDGKGCLVARIWGHIIVR